MKTLLLESGGRPVPHALLTYLAAAGWQHQVYAHTAHPGTCLETVDAVLLLSPCRVSRAYEYGEQLWYIWLSQQDRELPLLVAGYERPAHPNYLDLLQLDQQPADWWAQLQPVKAMAATDYRDSLRPRLQRFFAGHGQDSIVAVMSRIRRVVQMAERELQEMHTPYAEVYRDLIAPAELSDKWREWRNRWINYYPLFRYTPLAYGLHQLGQQAQQLDGWMLNGGTDAAPLASGEILTILNAVRDSLQEIENQYVLQKLSHTHRG